MCVCVCVCVCVRALSVQQQCERYWHHEHARYGSIDVIATHSDVVATHSDVTARTLS